MTTDRNVLKPYEHDRGARDDEGRFEPFYIPRAIMPQIDERDYGRLFAFLEERGVMVERELFHPDELRFHQRAAFVRNLPRPVAEKPILVSADLYILDGNHRAEWHLREGFLIDAFTLSVPFAEAVAHLSAFPEVHHAADHDHQHDPVDHERN